MLAFSGFRTSSAVLWSRSTFDAAPLPAPAIAGAAYNKIKAVDEKPFVLLLQALELLDKVVQQASNCLRLKMARGDCLAHLGRYRNGSRQTNLPRSFLNKKFLLPRCCSIFSRSVAFFIRVKSVTDVDARIILPDPDLIAVLLRKFFT